MQVLVQVWLRAWALLKNAMMACICYRDMTLSDKERSEARTGLETNADTEGVTRCSEWVEEFDSIRIRMQD